MSTDLTFNTMPRQGRVAVKKDEYKIGEINKDRKLKALNEDDQSLEQEAMKVKAVAPEPDDLTDDQGIDDEDDKPHFDAFA